MRRFAVLLAVLLSGSCSPGEEGAGTANKCATAIYPSYNPKVMEQCVGACIKCERGNTTTCTTSCTLKGAR
jgi:hypothetical protein